MKILHTADWHIGAYVGPQTDDHMVRIQSTAVCLEYLANAAAEIMPDIILVAGDLIHQSKTWADRSLDETRFVADILRQLGQVAPTVVLYGTPNHDNASGFAVLSAWDIPNVSFITEPALLTIETDDGPIQVAGVPGVDRGIFRAQLPGLSAEDENRAITAATADIIRGLSAQLESELPAVLMAHHTVIGCTLDNGQTVISASEPVIEAATIDSTGFDLVALGHIHRQQQVLDCRKPTFYCGSINANTFGDEKNQPGFLVHELMTDDWNNNSEQGHRWYSYQQFVTPARRFKTIRATIDFLHQLDGFRLDGEIIRVLYSGTDEQERAMDRRAIERILYSAGAGYVAEIRPESIEATVNREKLHESLDPESCLRRYLEGKGVTPDGISGIVDVALPIISTAMANAPAGGQSGIFLPISLEVVNYRSYAAEKLDFAEISFAMVNGRNGVGKSSLFMDALSDCLYEQPREGELTGWIRTGERSGSIMFTFRLGKSMWRVTRTRARSGKATLALAELEDLNPAMRYDPAFDLNWNDRSAQRMADTQQNIVNLLGMDADTFRSCVLIMQDAYGSFMEAKPEDRMSVLANLLGLGIYDQMESIAKGKLTDVNRMMRDLKDNAEATGIELSNLQPLKDELDAAEDERIIAAGRLEEIKGNRNAISAAAGNLGNVEAELEKAKIDLAMVIREANDANARVAELFENIGQANEFVGRKPELEAYHNQYLEAQSAVLGMQGHIDRLRDMESNRAAIEANQQMARIRLNDVENELHHIDAEMGKLSQKLLQLESLRGSGVALAEQDELKAQYDALQTELATLTTEHKRLAYERQSAVSKARAELEMVEKQIEMLGSSNCIDIGRAECKFLAEAKLIASTLEERKANYAAAITALDEFNRHSVEAVTKLNEKFAHLNYSPVTHNAIRENKRMEDALALEVAQEQTIRFRLTDAIARKDEYTKQLDAMSVELYKLSRDIDNLRPLCAGVGEARNKMNQLAEYERLYSELPAATRYISDTQPELDKAKQRVDELQITNYKISAEVERLEALALSAQDTTAALAEVDANIRVVLTHISSIDQAIGRLGGRLERLSELIERKARLESEISAAAAYASKLQMLVDAFGQEGIPHQIIRDIVPELEAQANHILGAMTSGQMRLLYRTEKTLKSNKNKEVATLDIIITDADAGDLPYLSRSGGQKVRAALAQSFALAMIKAGRVGLQLGMLFVDEPPYLDAEGSEAYCMALDTIHRQYPAMRIVAISHNPEMKAFFPQQITVESTEAGSKIKMN